MATMIENTLKYLHIKIKIFKEIPLNFVHK